MQQPTILVVESHPDLRAEIIATLAREHIACDGVSTGAAALLKIREHNYRYILLDVDAPTAGNTLYDCCAAEGTLAKLVLLTDFEETSEMPSTAKACAVLRKPFDTKQLLERVAR
jgi:DNA-binding response OmpR family regulator